MKHPLPNQPLTQSTSQLINQSTNQPVNQSTNYLLHLADTNLILAQRNGEWCGHGPVLEQDIAITNITLDLLGQARNFYQYAAELMGNTDEDQLAYLRTERQFKNLLLAELPRGDWAQTILRLFFLSAYFKLLYTALSQHEDARIAGIAEKSLKETIYHLRWSSEWVIRLGDGTEESKQRLDDAVKFLWPYTGEMFAAAAYEQNNGIDPGHIKLAWETQVKTVLAEANTEMPSMDVAMQSGGKEGLHTEHMGFILAEMQYLQRTYPGATW